MLSTDASGKGASLVAAVAFKELQEKLKIESEQQEQQDN
jgi:hypothetical protein